MPSDFVCPNCGAQATHVFYETENVPVHTCIMLSTRQEALDFPRGKVVLGFCNECGFIYNVAFDSSVRRYSSVYEDQQSFSSTFNTFAENLAQCLVKKHDLRNKEILEIGCGKGDFLATLCEIGNNSGVGIDPAYIKDRVHSKASDRLTFIQDYYSEKYSNYHGDLVCCRHTLEHIPKTFEFVSGVRRAIGNQLDTVVFFEVPDVTRVLRDLAFWDIYYEHCSYFSPASLGRLFRSCQFEITDLSRVFDDQYLLIETKPVNQKVEKGHPLEENINDLETATKHFSANYGKKVDQWKNRITTDYHDGRRVVVWGSGSKCVAFLSMLDVGDEIEYIVDINPFRHDRYLPGVGKKVSSPEILRRNKPDTVIVMNPIYHNEIGRMLDDMNVDADVISV